MSSERADVAAASHYLAQWYSASAPAYQSLWAPVLRPMGEHLIHELSSLVRLPGNALVLDLGTGTGALLPSVRRSLPNATLLGVDSATGMLERARAQDPKALLVAMEATALGFAAESLHLALLAFVLFHIPDPLAALREIRRVLDHKTGVLAVCTWGADFSLPGAEIWAAELDVAGALPDERPACLGQDRLMDSEEKLGSLLEAARLRPLQTWTRRFQRRWTADELLSLGAQYGLPHRRLRTLAPQAAAGCCERVAQALAALSPDALLYRPEIIYWVGRPA